MQIYIFEISKLSISAVKFKKSERSRLISDKSGTSGRGCIVSRSYLRVPFKKLEFASQVLTYRRNHACELTPAYFYNTVATADQEEEGWDCRRDKHAKGRRVSTRKLRERARFQALSQT